MLLLLLLLLFLININILITIAGQKLYYIGPNKDIKKEVITTEDRVKGLLHFYHSTPMGGHSGITNTANKISQHYYWHGFSADIEEYVSSNYIISDLNSTFI